jgi:glutamate---cysteine ligase / carboxylate-amine ligase
MTHPPVAKAPRDAASLGVEEEFHLVDLVTRRLTPRAAELLSALEGADGTFVSELQQTTIETNSAVADSLEALRTNLVALRRQLVTTAEGLGVGVVAAGCMPLAAPVQITPDARFQRMLADYQLLVREQVICGAQVHVGVEDRDTAAILVDRVSCWLPPLLALSASSPYSACGEDTGYASARSLIWSRWPTTGSAGAFASAADYEACVQDLIASGVISDAGMIYFDVRPSFHVPTLELRVCDSCPSVDTVVLVAALFRAVVARELARAARGEPSSAVAPALQRAAMWRAARSGLEGELVDLRGHRSVPAGALLRELLGDLRPELEATGSWALTRDLCEQALARGSSAARQREVLRQTGRVDDVVDLLVAETAGRSFSTPRVGTTPRRLAGYEASGYDEAVLPGGAPRPSHAAVLEALLALGAPALRERQATLARAEAEAGVVFRPTDEQHALPYPVDFVPRVITGEEWSRLQGGTAQRARALEAFVQDVYGDEAAVRDGIVPAALVHGAPGFRDAGRAPAAGQRRIHVGGFDVVRDADGRWLVLEDNVRVPSGVAFAIENRRLIKRVFPELAGLGDMLDPDEVPALLRRTLEEAAPPSFRRGSPTIALLGSGPNDSAFFEHRLLADEMSVPMAVPADLLVEDGVVRLAKDRSRIDVLYLRMDDQLDKSAAADGAALGPRLVEAVRRGNVTLANALGNGVADDKAVYAYVPQLIEYYLHEHPLLEQVRTYHCADAEQRRDVLARAAELVFKPVDGYGGHGVLIGPKASDEELAEQRRLVEREPKRWIAQDVVALSTHPTFDGQTFRPRHVDLRIFVYQGSDTVIVPAALTRVAPEGTMVVNSSRGGGAKDTWLLT